MGLCRRCVMPKGDGVGVVRIPQYTGIDVDLGIIMTLYSGRVRRMICYSIVRNEVRGVHVDFK